LTFDLFGEKLLSTLGINVKIGSVVGEGAVVDDGIATVAFIIEDVGAETVAPVTLGIISLITGETIAAEVLEAVEGFEPPLLLFPFGFSMFGLVFLTGGLTISGRDFPFLRSIH
jgi:hypothetical protein